MKIQICVNCAIIRKLKTIFENLNMAKKATFAKSASKKCKTSMKLKKSATLSSKSNPAPYKQLKIIARPVASKAMLYSANRAKKTTKLIHTNKENK